ncbi:transposase, partial [Deinococcus detaillensis]
MRLRFDETTVQYTGHHSPGIQTFVRIPILIIDKPRKKSGRPPQDARSIFNGLIWLARTGSQWSQFPRRYSPVSTAHERFSAWVEHGCLRRAWAVILEEYGEELGIDWEWQAADGSMVKAPLGKRGP